MFLVAELVEATDGVCSPSSDSVLSEVEGSKGTSFSISGLFFSPQNRLNLYYLQEQILVPEQVGIPVQFLL